jgi:hypothetical protein
MFYVNHEYLSQLDRPHEAITEDVWREWRSSLLNRSVSSENHSKLLEMPINIIATQAGVLWKTGSGDTISVILEKDFSDIKGRQHVGAWMKKGIALTISKLVELDDDAVTKIVTLPPSQKEIDNLIKIDKYNRARTAINKNVVDSRKLVNNDNYEDLMSNFIKLVIGKLASIAGYSEDRLKTYLPILYDRFYHQMTFHEIASKHDTHQGFVNGIIKRFATDFQEKVFSTSEDLDTFNNKFLSFYEKTYETLDREDLDIWAKRLDKMKIFSKSFIGKELD